MLNVTFNMQFKTVFSSFKDVKVINFSSMKNAFLNFTDKASSFLPLVDFIISFGNESTFFLSYAETMCNIYLDKRREIQETRETVCRHMVLRGQPHSRTHLL